ncbi:MAG: mercury resistance system periplasmic binding protein MerP [Zoogloea sp.]|nr:mercury resistance system periplasmic binding protein MerP [Zoogloea sp.]
MAADTRTVTLDVTKMDCAACPIAVRKALEKVPGVGSAKVDFKTRRAVVAFDPAKTPTEALTRATADAGFPSSVQQVQ